MTKLPQTISKKINIFTGCERGRYLPGHKQNRAVGGTTAVALSMLGCAQLHGRSFGFDYDNYDNSKSEIGARNLLATLQKLVTDAGLLGFTFNIRWVGSLRGLRGIDHFAITSELKPFEVDKAWGVVVEFDPYIKVDYDLRK